MVWIYEFTFRSALRDGETPIIWWGIGRACWCCRGLVTEGGLWARVDGFIDFGVCRVVMVHVCCSARFGLSWWFV